MIPDMTISEIRRTTARALAAKLGGPAEFARKVGMSDSHISQLLGDKPTKNIGNKIARRFEAAFGKPEGWLDAARTEEEYAEVGVQPKSVVRTDTSEKAPYVPFSIDPLEVEMINAFRKATPKGKLSIRAAVIAAEKNPDF